MMAIPLPAICTVEEYREICNDPERCRRAVVEISLRHGLPAEDLRRYSNGSTIVFAAGNAYVVKLFAPYDADEYATERLVLGYIRGALPIPTPELIASGDLDGWPYIVMEQLHGAEMREMREELTPEETGRICFEVGRGVSALHSLPVTGLEAITADWPEFIEQQKRECVDRQRGFGLDETWIEQIPGFLDGVDLKLDAPFKPSLLHTELMEDHIIIHRDTSGWEISGLIDFEPAMVGHPEYDFASVGLFLSCGDSEAFDSFMQGYGLPRRDNEFSRRIMAYALLHVYSNLKWYLERVPIPAGATTLDQLAHAWWPAL